MQEADPLREAANDSILNLLRNVIQQSEPRSRSDVVALALLYFMVRGSNTWRSMRTLDRYIPDDEGPMVDAGALLRVMFDAYLQAKYIADDRTAAVGRAQDYLEFEHIERFKQAQKVISCNNPFADKLKASPERPSGELRLQNEFDRVAKRYAVAGSRRSGARKGKVQIRQNWYPGTLADLAQSVGQADEYAIILSSFHGCVHSSALAVSRGPVVGWQNILDWASTIAARVAGLSVDYNNIVLDEFQSKLLTTLRRPYF